MFPAHTYYSCCAAWGCDGCFPGSGVIEVMLLTCPLLPGAFCCPLGTFKPRGRRWAPHGLCGGWALLGDPDRQLSWALQDWALQADLCWSWAVLLLQGQLFPPHLCSVIPSSSPVLGLAHLLCWKAGLAEEWLHKKIKLKGEKLKSWTQSPVGAGVDKGRE